MRKVLLLLLLLSCLSCISKDDVTGRFDEHGSSDGTAAPDTMANVQCEPWNKLGFDLLGLLYPRYQVGSIRNLLPPHSFIGVLDGSFGTDTTNLEVLLSSGRVGGVRVHLLNTVCLRNDNCGPSDNLTYRISPEAFEQKLAYADASFYQYITGRTAIYRNLSDRFPCVKFFISPMLEHDVNGRAFDNAASWIRASWPGITIVNNPHEGAVATSADLLECHGSGIPVACGLSSWDGTDIRRSSLMERQGWRSGAAQTISALSWSPDLNCREDDNSFTPISDRTNCADRSDFINILRLTYE